MHTASSHSKSALANLGLAIGDLKKPESKQRKRQVVTQMNNAQSHLQALQKNDEANRIGKLVTQFTAGTLSWDDLRKEVIDVKNMISSAQLQAA